MKKRVKQASRAKVITIWILLGLIAFFSILLLFGLTAKVLFSPLI